MSQETEISVSDELEVRKEKLATYSEKGINPFGYSFERSHKIANILSEHEG